MRPRTLIAASLAVLMVAPVASVTGSADLEGAIHRFDAEKFRRLGSIESSLSGDEFGTTVIDRFLVTAPGAEGGGRLLFVSEDRAETALSAADLPGRELARLGESWADLGHPPGTESVLAVGAPSEPARGSDERKARMRSPKPAVVLLEYSSGVVGQRFTREVRRVTGRRNSMFGWRVEPADSQFPEASFNGAFVVSAPLQNRGKKRADAGAVYKFDTETGKRIWRFRSKRGGELAGYSLKVIPDQDGDGFQDVLVGAPGRRASERSRQGRAGPLATMRDKGIPGRVYLLSGRTGKVLEQLEAPEGAVLFGFAVAWGGQFHAVQGLLVSAPATPKGRKDAVGAIYAYENFEDEEPDRFLGRRRTQWFGITIVQSVSDVLVGSFEHHRKAKRDARGSLTVLSPNGKVRKTRRGRKAGEYFGRAIALGRVVAVGAPGAPPLIIPE